MCKHLVLIPAMLLSACFTFGKIDELIKAIVPLIINWGKYREENARLVMPVTVRLNHAIADGYLVANVFRLLEQEIADFVG